MRMSAVLLVVLATRTLCEQESEKWLEALRNESKQLLDCGKKSYCSRTVYKDIEFDARCHCEPECAVFRDCCVDWAVRDDAAARDAVVRGIPADRWGCGLFAHNLVGAKPNGVPQHVSMVTRCPSGHRLSGLCHRRSDDPGRYSYLLDVAVLGDLSGIWYQNVYCAACHNEFQLRSYRPKFACSDPDLDFHELMEQATYEPGNLTWVFANGSMCRFQPTLNNTDTKDVGWVRSCPGGMVEGCPADADPSLAEKCRSYALFSMNEAKNQTFKNPHCALCHGVRAKCGEMFTTRSRNLGGPSLSFVMDVGWERSSRPDPTWDCEPPRGLWDVLHGRCLALDASRDPEEHGDGDGGDAPGACVSITLVRHEYRDLPGGGIALNSSLSDVFGDHEFHEGQFQRLPNGSIAVCRSLVEQVHEELVFYLSAAQVYITVVCLTVSAVCLALHIATYCLLPKLCNLPGKNLVALSWALLLAQLLLLVGVRPAVHVPRALCAAVAVALQYLFLAAFCWMAVMSADIWRTFSSSLAHANSARAHRKYACVAWGVPAAVCAATLAADLVDPGGPVAPRLAGARGVCWFGSRRGQALFFTLPVVALLAANAALFGATVYRLHRHTRDNYRYIRRKNKEELSATLSRSSGVCPGAPAQPPAARGVAGSRDEVRLYLYLKLFVVMGLTWTFGFLATLADAPALMYPFMVLNGMQGAFIFLMFDLKRSIGRMLWERLCGGRRAAPAFLDPRGGGGAGGAGGGGGANNNSSSSGNQKKVSATSSSLLSSGASRPPSAAMVDPRVSASPCPDEEAAAGLAGSRTSGVALLSSWLRRLSQSEVT